MPALPPALINSLPSATPLSTRFNPGYFPPRFWLMCHFVFPLLPGISPVLLSSAINSSSTWIAPFMQQGISKVCLLLSSSKVIFWLARIQPWVFRCWKLVLWDFKLFITNISWKGLIRFAFICVTISRNLKFNHIKSYPTFWKGKKKRKYESKNIFQIYWTWTLSVKSSELRPLDFIFTCWLPWVTAFISHIWIR